MRFLVVTLCCFVAPPIVRADPNEDAAIKAIKHLGGKVEQNGKPKCDLSVPSWPEAIKR